MKPTAVPTFVQKSRIHRTIFQIRDNELAISLIRPDGGFIERKVDLRTIDPDYQPRALRLHALVIIPGIIAVFSAIIVWELMQLPTAVPREPLLHFVLWPAVLFAMSFALVIKGSRRVEFYLFTNHWQKPAFESICEREQRDECAAFMAALVARIELSQTDLPDDERARLLEQVEAENQSLTPALASQKGKWSIALGALATGLTLVPGLVEWSIGLLLALVFVLCVGGIGFSYYSFLKKEPQRWWSLLGAVLSLIPPFFY